MTVYIGFERSSRIHADISRNGDGSMMITIRMDADQLKKLLELAIENPQSMAQLQGVSIEVTA